MSKPFDATSRRLIELDPPAWLACAGVPAPGPVRVVTADLSTVTAEADAILAVGDPVESLAHIELQSSRDRSLPVRLLRYNVLVHYQHERPVRSVAVLLRPQADAPEITGVYQIQDPAGGHYLEFRYEVIRVWELDLDALLEGGIGTLPLAPLTQEALNDPAPVIRRIRDRLDREQPPEQAAELWSATGILMGLRYRRDAIQHLLSGVRAMRDSVFYQMILEEGEAVGGEKVRAERRDHERATILSLGRRRFGEPPEAVVRAVESIHDLDRLDRVLDRILDAATWEDLLGLA